MPRMYRSLKAYCTTLSPVLDVPTSAARCLHACNDVRDPSSETWNCVGENVPVILPKWRLPRHLGMFYMPQIYDMGPTALLPPQRKACWGFFRPEKFWRLRPGLNTRTWVLTGSMLPPDHQSHLSICLKRPPSGKQYYDNRVWMMLLQLVGYVPENSNKEHNKEYSIFFPWKLTEIPKSLSVWKCSTLKRKQHFSKSQQCLSLSSPTCFGHLHDHNHSVLQQEHNIL